MSGDVQIGGRRIEHAYLDSLNRHVAAYLIESRDFSTAANNLMVEALETLRRNPVPGPENPFGIKMSHDMQQTIHMVAAGMTENDGVDAQNLSVTQKGGNNSLAHVKIAVV